MWKVAPAIATGNTVVLKPAEETPLPILYTLDLIDDIIPEGLVNVVTGFGTEAGQALVAHSNVRKISFTGSTKVGKEVMRMSADNVKDITLELGGKSPLIVFPDVDVQSAAETASNAIFFNTGEVCTAGSRLFVHSDIAERFINAFEEEASSLTVGDPLLEDTDLGPKVSEQQKERTLEYIEEAKDSDAKCLFGGKAPESEALSDGCFVLPTAFSDIDHDSRPVQEEIFGPVEMVFTWSDYDSMMELANDTEYGLAGGILSGDEGKARKAADDLEAGTIWVNQYGDFSLGMPFGGYKQSGIGRETSLEALQEYTQTKSVNFKLDQ
jgi:aldehyde dehydrogenase (NAD+)